jgi:hypothetical protein
MPVFFVQLLHLSISPGSRISYFMEFFDALASTAPLVHINDLLAFQAIALDDGIFQILNSIINRDNLGQFAKKAACMTMLIRRAEANASGQ